jgi:hypothetical protein
MAADLTTDLRPALGSIAAPIRSFFAESDMSSLRAVLARRPAFQPVSHRTVSTTGAARRQTEGLALDRCPACRFRAPDRPRRKCPRKAAC